MNKCSLNPRIEVDMKTHLSCQRLRVKRFIFSTWPKQYSEDGQTHHCEKEIPQFSCCQFRWSTLPVVLWVLELPKSPPLSIITPKRVCREGDGASDIWGVCHLRLWTPWIGPRDKVATNAALVIRGLKEVQNGTLLTAFWSTWSFRVVFGDSLILYRGNNPIRKLPKQWSTMAKSSLSKRDHHWWTSWSWK